MAPKTKTKPAQRKKKKDELEKYRVELLKYRDELRDAVKAHTEALPDTGLTGVSGDSSDHATADYMTSMFGALLEKQAGTLEEVELALSKIESGQFGFCEACEKNITAKRLKALPWAKYCLDCQDRMDRIEQIRKAQTQSAWETKEKE